MPPSDPTTDPHPAAAAVNAVLNPPATAPAGVIKWRDFGRAALSALVKSGAVYAVLTALGTVPNTPTAVAGVLAFCVTMLRLYTDNQAKPDTSPTAAQEHFEHGF